MRWLLWAVIVMACSVVCSLHSSTFARRRACSMTFLLDGAAGGRDDGRRSSSPSMVSIEDLVGRTLVYGGLSPSSMVAIDLAVLAGADRAARRLPRPAPGGAARAAGDRGPLRAAAAAAVAGAVRRLMLGDRDNPYDAVAGLASTLETADEGAGQLAAVARAVASGVRRRVRQRRGRPQRRRAAGRDVRRAGRPRPAPCRSPTATRRWAGWCCRPEGCAAGSRGATSSCSATWSARRRPPPGPAGWPTSSRTAASGWWSPARRSAAGSAATCTTGSARRCPVWCSGSSRRGCWSTATRRPPRRHLAATSDHVQDVVADVRRLVHDLRPPALDDRGLVGALRQHAERLGGRPVDRVDADDLGALPAAVEVAAYRIAGEALTNVARHAAATDLRVRLTGARRRAGRRGRRRRRAASPRDVAGRRRPGVAAGAGRRARRPQRGHLSRTRAAPSSGPGYR